MGTELISPPDTVSAQFYGVDLLVLPGYRGTDWVWEQSIREAMPFSKTEWWDARLAQIERIEVTVFHRGMPRNLRFINRRSFWDLAIQHSRFEEFKQKVLDLVEAKHDGRVFEVDPTLTDDLAMRNVMALAVATQNGLLALRRVAVVESKVSQLNGKVADLDRKVSDTERVRSEIVGNLTALPTSGLSSRDKVRMIINNYASLSGMGYSSLYNKAYKSFYYEHGISLKYEAEKRTREQGRKVLPIDVADWDGHMEKLLDIVTKLYPAPDASVRSD